VSELLEHFVEPCRRIWCMPPTQFFVLPCDAPSPTHSTRFVLPASPNSQPCTKLHASCSLCCIAPLLSPVQCRTATVVFPTLFFAKPLPSPPCATPPCPLIIDFVLHTSMCAQGHRVRACTRPPRSRMQGRTLTHESLAVGR
jgi:hypothetical protein